MWSYSLVKKKQNDISGSHLPLQEVEDTTKHLTKLREDLGNKIGLLGLLVISVNSMLFGRDVPPSLHGKQEHGFFPPSVDPPRSSLGNGY